jgi:hypothetical protein
MLGLSFSCRSGLHVQAAWVRDETRVKKNGVGFGMNASRGPWFFAKLWRSAGRTKTKIKCPAFACKAFDILNSTGSVPLKSRSVRRNQSTIGVQCLSQKKLLPNFSITCDPVFYQLGCYTFWSFKSKA